MTGHSRAVNAAGESRRMTVEACSTRPDVSFGGFPCASSRKGGTSGSQMARVPDDVEQANRRNHAVTQPQDFGPSAGCRFESGPPRFSERRVGAGGTTKASLASVDRCADPAGLEALLHGPARIKGAIHYRKSEVLSGEPNRMAFTRSRVRSPSAPPNPATTCAETLTRTSL